MKILRILAAVAPILLARSASAHFLWASFDSGKARKITIELAETPGDSTVPGVAGKADAVKGWLSKGRSLKLDKVEKGLSATLPEGENVGGASVLYGILDRSAQNRGVFLLEYYAKAATDASAAGVNLGLKAEIVASLRDGKLVLTTLLDKKPAGGAEVNVVIGSSPAVDLKADAKGQVSVDWKGEAVAARAMIAETKTGEFEGQKYSLVRNYATLAIGTPVVKPATDPKAYALLKAASDARASFPENLLGFSADITADVEGRTVAGHFVYDRENGLSMQFSGGDAKDQDWVKGQLRSLILHRSTVPFEKGDGAYPITFTGSENALGTQVALADSMQSRYRIKGNEILEVDRAIGGGRLVVCVLDSLKTKQGRTLSTQLSVTQFNASGVLQSSQMITDQFVEQGDGVFPSVRRVLATTDKGAISTRVLKIANLKVVLS